MNKRLIHITAWMVTLLVSTLPVIILIYLFNLQPGAVVKGMLESTHVPTV
jgi:hypothetical protein